MKLPTLESEPRDRLGRPLDDLRISVIDRCNFRCSFCMPAGHKYTFLPREQLLSFEEIARLAAVFVDLGVSKIRLTGGEPLLRRELEHLVEMLVAIPGVEDLALTTNGVLLVEKAEALVAAGLHRVTVSLPALDDDTFAKMSGEGHTVADVLAGIEAASAAGLGPIKVNAVVMRGVNENQIVPLARFLKERGHIARFIEFMDVGTVNDWDRGGVVSARSILETIDAELPLERLPRRKPNDVALRFRYLDDGVEGGVIASITEPFCGDCSRARLTADGKFYTCLFAAQGLDLKQPLREGQEHDGLARIVRSAWSDRSDRYSEERAASIAPGGEMPIRKIEMFRIGG